jgi:DNA-binding HxlR family transcriptional regulator
MTPQPLTDRWGLRVLRAAARGQLNFDDLGVPRDVLADRLEALVEEGLLEPIEPLPRYRLTAKGRDLQRALTPPPTSTGGGCLRPSA